MLGPEGRAESKNTGAAEEQQPGHVIARFGVDVKTCGLQFFFFAYGRRHLERTIDTL